MIKTIPRSLLLIGFAFSFAFYWASDPAYRATVSKLLRAVADVGFGGISGHLSAHPLSFLKKWDQNILNFIENGKRGAERGMVTQISKLAEPFIVIVGSVLAIGLALYELAKYVKHVASHAVTHVVVHKIVQPVKAAAQSAASVTKVQFNHLTARVAQLEHRIAHIAHATAGAIASPFPRIGNLERDIANAKKWIKSHSYLARYATLAALGAAIISRLGLGHLRCDNNKRLGKAVCGFDKSWLDEFLLGAILIMGTNSFHDFVKEAQAGVDLGFEGLQLFIREFGDLPIPKS